MPNNQTTENVLKAYQDVINTRTKSKASVKADCELYMASLAPIVGGVAGKISPPTGYGCADGLTVQEQGTVSNVMPFTGEGISKEPIAWNNLYLREARFVNRISAGTVSMIRRIRNYDPTVLSPAFSMPAGPTDADKVRYAVLYSNNYKSSFYELMLTNLNDRVIMRSDANYIRMMLLEGMHLYMELYRIAQSETYASDLTSKDMTQILLNIEALIQYFLLLENQKSEFNRLDIVHELRQLERYVLAAKTDIIDYL